jgi:RNA polymerase sigma factor (sigma-70 family)
MKALGLFIAPPAGTKEKRRRGFRTMGDENYVEGIFSELSEITKDFDFETDEGPEGETQEEQRRRGLLNLITTVRKMAQKRFRQMPEDFRAAHDDDDCVQEAMTTLIIQTRQYKPKEGYYYYNKYMAGILGWRLTSLQRSVFRKNPLVDEDLRKFVGAKRRELGREPTAEEISDITGVTPEHARRALSEGVGATRRIVRESEGMDMDLNESSGEETGRPGSSPEQAYLNKEFRMIVLECIGRLEPYDRYVVILRYFAELSFADISKITLEVVGTARTQCWRAFGQLRDCVLDRYGARALKQ